MPTASAYGTTNPRGLEPWPIEQTLAPLAVGGSQAEAQMMLENYQQQRDAAANVYSGDLQQQHQYAYDQLAQQLQENYLKALPENAKAGTLGILASSPQYSAAFGGADPGVIGGVIQRAQSQQDADTFQKSMTGLNQGSQGGYQIAGPTGSIPGLPPNMQLTNKGPALEQAAVTRGQYGLAAASLNANKPQTTTVSTALPPEADGTTHNISTPKTPMGSVQSVIGQHNDIAKSILDTRAGTPTTSLAPAGGGTAAKPAAPAQLDTSSPLGKQAQTAATVKMQRATQAAAGGDPAAKAMVDDVRGAMKGQTFTIIAGPNGQPVLKGRTGNYALGN